MTSDKSPLLYTVSRLLIFIPYRHLRHRWLILYPLGGTEWPRERRIAIFQSRDDPRLPATSSRRRFETSSERVSRQDELRVFQSAFQKWLPLLAPSRSHASRKRARLCGKRLTAFAYGQFIYISNFISSIVSRRRNISTRLASFLSFHSRKNPVYVHIHVYIYIYRKRVSLLVESS